MAWTDRRPLLRRHRPDPGRHDRRGRPSRRGRAARASCRWRRRAATGCSSACSAAPISTSPGIGLTDLTLWIALGRVAGVDGGGHDAGAERFRLSGACRRVPARSQRQQRRNGSEETMSKTVRRTLLAGTVLASALTLAASAGPGADRRSAQRGAEMGRSGVPASTPLQGAAAGGAGVVHRGRRAVPGHGRSTSSPRPSPPTCTSPRRWPRPSRRSPASRSSTTSSRRATSSRSCRRRCSRARTSTTCTSTTPT